MRIPEHNKRAGVQYAVSPAGIELPVVNITHPAFAVDVDEAEVARLVVRFLREFRWRTRLPAFLQRLMIQVITGRSLLGRGLVHGIGGFVDGMTMYMAKLGPENLGAGWAGRGDRWVAASLPSFMARVRLQDMARLLVDGLAPALEARPGQPLHLLNVAGGPAADSWNVLLLLRTEHPEWLSGRPVVIHVLDRDEEGPAFGARAVAALREPAGPLSGTDVSLQRVAYDWRDVAVLRTLLEGLGLEQAVVGFSSEGGLFEYGTGEEVVANLDVLRRGTPPDSVVVGSVTRADGAMQGLPAFSVYPRSLDAFGALAQRAGWVLAQAIDRPFSYNVRLSRTG